MNRDTVSTMGVKMILSLTLQNLAMKLAPSVLVDQEAPCSISCVVAAEKVVWLLSNMASIEGGGIISMCT